MLRLLKSSVLIAALLGAAPLIGAQAAEEAYPARPVRVIIPVSAGGWQDTMSRLIAQKMEPNLGQAVIIENRPSAGSLVGTQFVARSAPDGYTLLAVSNTFAISPSVVADAGYSVTDFVAIGEMIRSPMLIVVGASSPVRSVADLREMSKKSPEGIPYASGGTGSTSHLVPEMFASQAGIHLLHIPYKGNSPAIPDVMSGRVQFIFSPISSAIGFIKSGKLRPIAITTAKRSPAFPAVPTLAEAGLTGFDATVYSALLAPAATPQPVINRLKVALSAAKSNPELIAKVEEVGDEVAPDDTKANVTAFLREEAARYAKIVKEKGIKGE